MFDIRLLFRRPGSRGVAVKMGQARAEAGAGAG